MKAPGDLLGHYRIVSALGAGGMGEVYLAEDTRLRRRVAVKVLPAARITDAERRKRFLREARAAAAVDHPNIIHIYDVQEEEDGGIYLVMQHVDGKSLRQILAAGKIDVEKSLALASEIADALAAAHAHGIVHRDIKPDNIMVDAAGHARILDFGLARGLEGPEGAGPMTAMETADPHVTASGAVMGTMAYMSPEQARGIGADARSDLFSFGVTLYEMIVGRHPFIGRTSIETMDSLLNHDPKPVSEIHPESPPALEWILSKMLAKDRDERYQSAKEVLADLRKIRQSTTISVPAVPARARSATRRIAARSALVLSVFAFLAVLFLLIRGRTSQQAALPEPPPPPFPAGAVPKPRRTMRIAVLPLQNVTNDARIGYLGFALADAMISKLSYVNSVTVRPSSYVQKYRDTAPDPKQAGAELGVDHLLTGTLLAQGETLRISVQLIDLGRDTVVWQDLFDARLDNLLGVQDEIVGRLVKGMTVTITPAEASRLQRDVPQDPEAFDLFLKATAEPKTHEGDQQAASLLRQSLDRDAAFAPAWNELGQRQYDMALYSFGGGADYLEAQKSLNKALELNPDLPEALYATGIHLVESGRHEEAYRVIKRRLAANPSDAWSLFLLSYLYRYTGLLQESAEKADQALALDPRNRQFRSGGRTYFYLGAVDRAVPFITTDAGTSWAYYNFADGELIRGDFPKADAYAVKCVQADPNGVLATRCLAMRAGIAGDNARAMKLMDAFIPTLTADPEVTYGVAIHLAWLGDTRRAAEFFSRAVQGGFFPYQLFDTNVLLKGKGDDPRFAPLIAEMRRKSDAFRAFVAANP